MYLLFPIGLTMQLIRQSRVLPASCIAASIYRYERSRVLTFPISPCKRLERFRRTVSYVQGNWIYGHAGRYCPDCQSRLMLHLNDSS